MSTRSRWQLKYGRAPREDEDSFHIPSFNDEEEQHDEIQSLEQWMSRNDDVSSIFSAERDNDDEVAQVIKEMEKVLSHDFMNTIDDDHSSDDFECGDMMKGFTINFDLPTNENAFHIDVPEASIPPVNITNQSINITGNSSFSTDQMMILFLKGRSDKMARKCLRALAGHCKREKKRLQRVTAIVCNRLRGKALGRSFLCWKKS